MKDKLKIAQLYNLRSSYSDKIEIFSRYPTIMNRGPTHDNMMLGDFNAKVEKKVAGETALGYHGGGSRSE